MVDYKLSEIKFIRRKLGLTQSKLAKSASVSQSLIAKIETGNIDPTYSNMQKISDALDALQQKKSRVAKDFIHKRIVFCQEKDLVRDVIKKMKQYEISQLPVINEKAVIGIVSETRIIESLLDSSNKKLKVKDVMGEIPPIIASSTPETVISNLLKFFSLVIVQDRGETKGIITRADILRKVYG